MLGNKNGAFISSHILGAQQMIYEKNIYISVILA